MVSTWREREKHIMESEREGVSVEAQMGRRRRAISPHEEEHEWKQKWCGWSVGRCGEEGAIELDYKRPVGHDEICTISNGPCRNAGKPHFDRVLSLDVKNYVSKAAVLELDEEPPKSIPPARIP